MNTHHKIILLSCLFRGHVTDNKCQILLYADDTVMYFSAADSQIMADSLTNELVFMVNKWLLDNDWFVHEGKTECTCMLFGAGPKLALSTSFSIAIDGKALNRVSEQ